MNSIQNAYHSSLFDNDFLVISGEAFLVSGAILLLMYGVVYSNYQYPSSFPSPLLPQHLSSTGVQNAVMRSRDYSLNENVSTDEKLVRTGDNKEASLDRGNEQIAGSKYVYSPQNSVLESPAEEVQSARYRGHPILVHNCGWHTLLILFFAILLLKDNPLLGEAFYNSLIIDEFTRFLEICVCVAASLSLLISLQYGERINSFEVLVLILCASASMLFLASASDLICVYLAIELQSLCFYVLAGLKRNSEFSTEAGLKYFLLGAFSSGILLFGCSLLYCFTGSTSFFEYGHLFSDTGITSTGMGGTLVGKGTNDLLNDSLPLRGCQLGFTFLLVGLLFKCSAAPFHMWAPDVYEGAPTSITAFFSIVPKLAVFAVLIRMVYTGFYELVEMTSCSSLIVFSCIASLLVGTFSAISQNKIKRLLAYSSIGHVGYMLIGLSTHSGEGLVALLVYLLIYIAMTITMFAVVLSPLAREPYSQMSARSTHNFVVPKQNKESSQYQSSQTLAS